MPQQTDEMGTTESSDDRPTVTAHQSVADRTVFTEDGNGDGWIATNLTVDLWR